jgi:hypothetical protein
MNRQSPANKALRPLSEKTLIVAYVSVAPLWSIAPMAVFGLLRQAAQRVSRLNRLVRAKRKKAGWRGPPGREELRGDETQVAFNKRSLGSGRVVNLTAYFVARLVVNGREIVLLTTMLFGLLQDFVRAGAPGFPWTTGKASVGAAEWVVIVTFISAVGLSNCGHFCLQNYCAANPELNGARSKAAGEKSQAAAEAAKYCKPAAALAAGLDCHLALRPIEGEAVPLGDTFSHSDDKSNSDVKNCLRISPLIVRSSQIGFKCPLSMPDRTIDWSRLALEAQILEGKLITAMKIHLSTSFINNIHS